MYNYDHEKLVFIYIYKTCIEFGDIDTALIRRSKGVVVRYGGRDWQSCHEYTAIPCVVIVLL